MHNYTNNTKHIKVCKSKSRHGPQQNGGSWRMEDALYGPRLLLYCRELLSTALDRVATQASL